MRRLILMLTLMCLLVGGSPSAAQEDVAQRNKTTVRDAIAKLNTGDVDGFYQMYADPFQMNEGDAVLHDQTVSDIAPFAQALVAAIPDLQVTPEVLIAQDDWIAVELSFSGTFTQPFTFFGADPTNQPVYWTEMHFMRFDDAGQLVEDWGVSDPTVMFSQMGMIPPSEMQENGTGTPLTPPAGHQLLSEDELAASYNSGRADQSLAQFQANFDLGLGGDSTRYYTDPFISWSGGTPYSVTRAEARADLQFLQAINAAMPDVQSTLGVVVAEGDWVAGLARVQGTSTESLDLGEMGVMEPTGQSMVWQIGIIDHYNADGQIAEEWVETDPSPMLVALGLMPPPGEGQ